MKIFGRNPVIERLRANPQSIKKIYIQHGFKGTTYIHKKARPHGIPIFTITRNKMQKIGRSANNQGILIDVEDFEYIVYDDLLENALNKNRSLVFLDRLNDPQNLGAIIRSLACLGKFSIVLPTHESVAVTEAVLRVASGGENYVYVSRVTNINTALKKAKEKGFWIAAAVVEGGRSLVDTDLPHPLGVVIGSEQKGIKDVILKNVDMKISIPMYAETLSYNAAQATTIICYEITRQKELYKKKQKE